VSAGGTYRVTGTVVAVRPGPVFRVELENGHCCIGHVPQRKRAQAMKLAPGDRVEMEMVPADMAKGRVRLEEI